MYFNKLLQYLQNRIWENITDYKFILFFFNSNYKKNGLFQIIAVYIMKISIRFIDTY